MYQCFVSHHFPHGISQTGERGKEDIEKLNKMEYEKVTIY